MSDLTSRPATASHPTRQQLDDLEALMQRMLALPVNQRDDDAAAAAAVPVIGAVAVETPPHTIAPPPELKDVSELPKPASPRTGEPRTETPPVDNWRGQNSAVNYRHPETPAAEPPKPALSRLPESRVDLPPVESRPAPTPAVDYPRLEVAPVALFRAEIPKPDYRIPDVTPMHLPDVSPLPAPLEPPATPPLPKAVEAPTALNGKNAPHELAGALNGKDSLVPKERLVQPLIKVSLQPMPPRPAPLLRRKPTRAFRRPIAGMLLAPMIWSNLTFDRWVGRCGRLGRWFRTPAGRMLVGFLGLTFLSAAIAWVVINGMGWTH